VNYYADTSFLVAVRFRADTFHREAVAFYEGREMDQWLWSPWHRVEVFNTLRQLTRNSDPKLGLQEAEARALIHRFENEDRLGYFLHMEADWRDVMRAASEISLTRAFEQACPATDLLHVAYAVELAADLFITFDKDQAALARSAGLKVANPAED
jgi:predicted nucleic acid-binding protein